MRSHTARPKWWQIYLTLPLLVTLFVADSKLKISSRGHQAVQIGIVLIVYGLIYLWIKANARAMREMDRQQYRQRIRVLQILPVRLPETNNENYPMLQLPTPEVKGMFSDTFEIDYIEAEVSPANEIPQITKKE